MDLARITRMRRGVLCGTELRSLGLWVLEEGRLHVATSPHSSRIIREDAHVHWSQPAVPRDPFAKVDPIANVLTLVDGCQPRDAALAIWNSALSQSLISLEELSRLPVAKRNRGLLNEATPSRTRARRRFRSCGCGGSGFPCVVKSGSMATALTC